MSVNAVPKRVLVQVNSLALGGTQLNAIDLAHAVRPLGFDSVLIGPEDTLPTEGPSALDVAKERGVDMTGYRRVPGGVLRRAQALAGRADSASVDLVHVYGAWADPRSAYWGPCRAGRRPLVHTVYEMSVDPGLFRRTSLIIGTRYLQDDLALRPGPTTLISPPVDVVADAPNAERAGQFRSSLGDVGSHHLVVIVSRLDHPMKTVPLETAIRAMTLLPDGDATLVVVGDGSEASRLIKLGEHVNQQANAPRVRFVGPMADPRSAYAAADIVLGMGGSAARALSHGRPLIVQGERGTSECFEPATAEGLFRRSFWNPAPAEDGPEELARAVRALLAAPSRREELGEAGRRFAVGHFGLQAMAERLALVYERALTSYDARAWARDLDREALHAVRTARARLVRSAGRDRP